MKLPLDNASKTEATARYNKRFILINCFPSVFLIAHNIMLSKVLLEVSWLGQVFSTSILYKFYLTFVCCCTAVSAISYLSTISHNND